jgi:hypothetical protein
MLFLFLKIDDCFARVKGAMLVDEAAIYTFQTSYFPASSEQTHVHI